MWVSFFLAWMSAIAILYLPGYFVMRTAGASRLTSFAAAPPLAAIILELLCVIYDKLNIPANPLTVVLPAILLGLFAYLASRFVAGGDIRVPKKVWVGRYAFQEGSSWPARFCQFLKSDTGCLFLYMGVSTIIAGLIFIGTLDGSASFPQDSDNSAHLSWIRSFADSQILSTLNVSFYHDLVGEGVTLVNTAGGYYPAGWHMVCALVMQACNVPAPLAANAVNFTFLSIVLPSGLFLFFRKLFQGKRGMLYCGAFMCLAFPSFPWGLILPPQGPLYPNFAAFVLLPFACWAFMEALACFRRRREFALYTIHFIVSAVAIGIMHPNGVFSLYAIVAVYATVNSPRWLYRVLRKRGRRQPWQIALLAAITGCVVFMAAALGWLLFMQVPPIARIVGFSWAPYLDLPEAFCRVLTLSFGRPNEQVVLPFIVAIGIAYSLWERRFLWLSVAFSFFCISFVAAAATSGFWDSLLTGFWYTDGNRVAANAGLIGIPLAAIGLYTIVHLIQKVVAGGSDGFARRAGSALVAGCLVATFLFLNFSRCVGDVWTSFDDIGFCFMTANDTKRPNTYDPEERAFVQRVKEVVDPDELILNVADDGSSFAYAEDGLNLVYRRSSNSGRPGDDDAGLLRKELDALGSSSEVRDILERNGISYILLLDKGGDIRDERCYYGYYRPDDWEGYNAIDDSTPGLETVLSEGDMRLYKIVG